MKRTPALTKNEIRPKTCSISSCASAPRVPLSLSCAASTRSRAASSTAIALLIA
jgi:hypothetical protein